MTNKTIYRYFLKHFRDADYLEYTDNLDEQKTAFLETEEQDQKLIPGSDLFEIRIYDVVENNEFKKLIKGIYSLPSSRFLINCAYKKPALKKNLYIPIKFDTTSYGLVANIKLLDDCYIDSIEVLYSSLDSWRFFLEFIFVFKKEINENYDDFIRKNLLKNCENDSSLGYKISSCKEYNYDWMHSLHPKIINLVLERFLKALNYKKHLDDLTSMFVMAYNKEFDFNSFIPGYMERAFINPIDNYVIYTSPFQNEYYLLSDRARVPNIHISRMIMDYGSPFYYLFFGEGELVYSKCLLNPVVSSIKSIKPTIMEYMFKRLNALQNQELERARFYSRFNEDGWYCKASLSPEKVDISEFAVQDFKEFYSKYYYYCKSLLETKNTLVAKWLSIAAIVISFIGIVASVVLSFITHS